MKILLIPIFLAILLSACSTTTTNDTHYLCTAPTIEDAKALYDKGNLTESRDICEGVLSNNPYNKNAIKLLTAINQSQYANSIKKDQQYQIMHNDLSPYYLRKAPWATILR